MKVRSLVGLMPLCTPVGLDERQTANMPGLRKRADWFVNHNSDLARHMSCMTRKCPAGKEYGLRLLALPNEQRLRRLLARMLDEGEFLSDYGIRSLSARHAEQPFVFELDHFREEVRYIPGESETAMFGGNSNWRGPIWLPINYLIIQSLRIYHAYYGETFQIECPTGSGKQMNLEQVACELERRLVRLFLLDPAGSRPAHGGQPFYSAPGDWRELVLVYEYFHGDSGKGLGASHQTGWTSLVASMLQHAGQAR